MNYKLADRTLGRSADGNQSPKIATPDPTDQPATLHKACQRPVRRRRIQQCWVRHRELAETNLDDTAGAPPTDTGRYSHNPTRGDNYRVLRDSEADASVVLVATPATSGNPASTDPAEFASQIVPSGARGNLPAPNTKDVTLATARRGVCPADARSGAVIQ